jgi:hypothetical protein
MSIKTTVSTRDIAKYLQNITAPVKSYTADGAITVNYGIVNISKTSAAAMTIAAPTTSQNGIIITIISSSAYAHVVTFTGATFVNGDSSAHTTATFAAKVGASVRIVAYGGKWYQSGISNVTMS